jgi:hypothetical protein
MNDDHDDEHGYLRFYVAHLVRIWAALRLVRGDRSIELIRIFQDLCSDKLRIMLHELATKKKWTLGFSADGTPKQQRLFQRLVEANKWFEGYKNGLHYRNCSGAHMQPLDKADHMFQHFGYGGEREWKHLTRGVAACLAMMKVLDGNRRTKFWRGIRTRVASQERQEMRDLPIGVEALLQGFIVERPPGLRPVED